ncbi:hypothetical protein BGX28_000156 [Mortierella sp. GBA30]|nr:hypothetical protein BGX28_000156 [Mortierella sp. GBA30]
MVTTSGSSEPSANGSKKNNQVQNQLSISAAANATDRKNAKSDAIIVSTPMATERSEAAIEVTNDVTVQKGLIVSMSRDSTFSEDEHTADLLEQWRANLENCPAQSSHTSTPTSILAPIPTSITDRVQSKEYEEPCQQDTTDTNLPVSKRKVDSLYGSRRSSMAPIPHKRRKRGARDRRAGQEVGTMKNMGPMSSIADIIRSELDDSVILKRAVETVATIDTTDLTKESDTSKENEVEMEKENVSSEVDMAMHPEQSAQITQIDIEEAKRRVEALCQSYTIVSNTSNKGASVEIEEGEIVETAAPTNSLKGDQYNMRSIGIRTEIEPASSSESMSAFERITPP